MEVCMSHEVDHCTNMFMLKKYAISRSIIVSLHLEGVDLVICRRSGCSIIRKKAIFFELETYVLLAWTGALNHKFVLLAVTQTYWTFSSFTLLFLFACWNLFRFLRTPPITKEKYSRYPPTDADAKKAELENIRCMCKFNMEILTAEFCWSFDEKFESRAIARCYNKCVDDRDDLEDLKWNQHGNEYYTWIATKF